MKEIKQFIRLCALLFIGCHTVVGQDYSFPQKTYFLDDMYGDNSSTGTFYYYPNFTFIGFSEQGRCAYVKWGNNEFFNYFDLIIQDVKTNKVLWTWKIEDNAEEVSSYTLKTCQVFWEKNQQRFDEKLSFYGIKALELPLSKLPITREGEYTLDLSLQSTVEKHYSMDYWRINSFSAVLDSQLIYHKKDLFLCNNPSPEVKGYFRYKNYDLVLVLVSKGGQHGCGDTPVSMDLETFIISHPRL